MTIKKRRTRRERELSRLIKTKMTKALSLYFSIRLENLVDENNVRVCPEPIEFWARPFLEKEHRELMQSHFGLSEEEREANQHDYAVALLSKVASKAPKGLPGFPEQFDDLEKAIADTLGPKTEVNEMIASLLLSEHLASGGNRYFFR